MFFFTHRRASALVLKAVAAIMIRTERGMGSEAENAEAVVHRYDYHITGLRHVVEWVECARSPHECAAVQPDDHGTLPFEVRLVRIRHGDIDMKAIFVKFSRCP
jgi:hypothetical protein